MAKGQRGKGQPQSVATANATTANGPNNSRKPPSAPVSDLEADKQMTVKSRNRNKEKHKSAILNHDDLKADFHEETTAPIQTNHVNEKPHAKVQPTTEQLMIAKIIDPSDDPHQRKKIQQVMDVTGKPEDEVATALFDAGWDESRAVELLLEDGDHLSAWEETGKKKKSKKAPGDDKDDWDNDNDGFHEATREKSRGRGPPRMRRGGGNNKGRDHAENGGEQVVPSGGRGSGGPRRGDLPPRRGGRGGGAGRGFSGRQQPGASGGATNGMPKEGPGRGEGAGGFQGSIDTWNNPGDQQGGERADAGGSGGGGGSASNRPRRGGPRGGHGSKDAFDNAGNWGDDFPQADDWDNEEYTGSLADTKVFTSSQQGGKQKPQGQQQQPAPVGSNNSQRSFSASLTSNGPSGSFSQSIDLSTLLQKPTTQSSVGASAAPVSQFNQQQASDTLKAVVGISTSSSANKDSSPYSYAQASAFTSINKGGQNQSSQQQPPKQPQQISGQAVGSRTSARMPPQTNSSSSKIPAVEMPGDSLGRLDVQFGGLDLQFGGGSSSSATGADVISGAGFEFGSSEDKTATNAAKPVVTGSDGFAPPSAKEVNKSLSNALSSGGKLNSGASLANASNNQPMQQQQLQNQDSFSSKPMSGQQGPPMPHAAPGSGSNSYGKQADLYSNYNNFKGYNNYQQQQQQQQQQYQYPSSNSYSSHQQGGSSYNKGGQYDKYDSQQGQLQNPAAAVLGLASTSTTNALSGKVSATTANKVNIAGMGPNQLPSMLHPSQYMAAGLAPAFYGLQQPAAMYGYGNAGLEDLAAIQRASASALHTLPTAGYYDPNNQFAATSLGVAANSRDGSNNLSSLANIASTVSSTGSSSAAIGSSSGSSGFGSGSSAAASTNDSTSSPGPNTSSANNTAGQHVQQQQQQQQQQQTAFNLAASSAYAAQQVPPGYAYYFGSMGLQPAAYGAATATQGHMYQATAMTVPGAGATGTSQFQKSYGTNYGSGYDALGQQGNKEFSASYSANGQSKSTGGSAGSGSGHQYWGNTLTSQGW